MFGSREVLTSPPDCRAVPSRRAVFLSSASIAATVVPGATIELPSVIPSAAVSPAFAVALLEYRNTEAAARDAGELSDEDLDAIDAAHAEATARLATVGALGLVEACTLARLAFQRLQANYTNLH